MADFQDLTINGNLTATNHVGFPTNIDKMFPYAPHLHSSGLFGTSDLVNHASLSTKIASNNRVWIPVNAPQTATHVYCQFRLNPNADAYTLYTSENDSGPEQLAIHGVHINASNSAFRTNATFVTLVNFNNQRGFWLRVFNVNTSQNITNMSFGFFDPQFLAFWINAVYITTSTTSPYDTLLPYDGTLNATDITIPKFSNASEVFATVDFEPSGDIVTRAGQDEQNIITQNTVGQWRPANQNSSNYFITKYPVYNSITPPGTNGITISNTHSVWSNLNNFTNVISSKNSRVYVKLTKFGGSAPPVAETTYTYFVFIAKSSDVNKEPQFTPMPHLLGGTTYAAKVTITVEVT